MLVLNLIKFQLFSVFQTHYSLCEWICFAYGSDFESIRNVVCRTKATLANCSRVSCAGRDLGDCRLPVALLKSHALFLRFVKCLSNFAQKRFCLRLLALPPKLQSLHKDQFSILNCELVWLCQAIKHNMDLLSHLWKMYLLTNTPVDFCSAGKRFKMFKTYIYLKILSMKNPLSINLVQKQRKARHGINNSNITAIGACLTASQRCECLRVDDGNELFQTAPLCKYQLKWSEPSIKTRSVDSTCCICLPQSKKKKTPKTTRTAICSTRWSIDTHYRRTLSLESSTYSAPSCRLLGGALSWADAVILCIIAIFFQGKCHKVQGWSKLVSNIEKWKSCV